MYVIYRIRFGYFPEFQAFLRDNYRCLFSGVADWDSCSNLNRLSKLQPDEDIGILSATRIIPFRPNPTLVSESALRHLNLKTRLLRHRDT
jgi:hypothetical protein